MPMLHTKPDMYFEREQPCINSSYDKKIFWVTVFGATKQNLLKLLDSIFERSLPVKLIVPVEANSTTARIIY